MNILLDGFVCPNCFNTYDRNKGEELNHAFTFDRYKGETYCNKCGLVVRDASIPTLEVLRYLSIRDRAFKKTDLYEVIKKEKRFVDSYEYIMMVRTTKLAIEKAEAEERARKREERKAKAKATREKNKKKNKSKKKKKAKKKDK